MVALVAGHRTCVLRAIHRRFTGRGFESSPGTAAALRSDLRQATYIWTKQYNLIPTKGQLRSAAGKLTIHRSNKNCANFFLSELRQISTNFDNFWQKYDKEAKIMQGALTFHLN